MFARTRRPTMISTRDELLHVIDTLSDEECGLALELLEPLTRPEDDLAADRPLVVGKTEPERYYLSRDELTYENLMALYELLTGRKGTPEEDAEARALWEEFEKEL